MEPPNIDEWNAALDREMDADLRSFAVMQRQYYCDRCYTRVDRDHCPGCGRMWCCQPGPVPIPTAQPVVLPQRDPWFPRDLPIYVAYS